SLTGCLCREHQAIVDAAGRVIVYLAGSPDDKSWPDVARAASREMDEIAAHKATNFMAQESNAAHTRGRYPVLHAGFTFGGGPQAPHNVGKKDAKRVEARKRLTRNEAFIRLAGFASSAFRIAAPKLFTHYDTAIGDVKAGDSGLRPAFANSVFPTATFNFGPRAETLPHRDYQNVPYGWCAVTALGDYNPKLGGHIYLWELGLVVEFPPGATILLPSAVVTHGNTPIQEGETRKAFTQYCAGALMRWHAYGMRTERTLLEEVPGMKEALDQSWRERWRTAVCYFSKINELAADSRACL
ncbi:hypothetical protein BV25DRAFT_1816180, partial [Artomyces pyxidatus]